jgi:hypothetical protein
VAFAQPGHVAHGERGAAESTAECVDGFWWRFAAALRVPGGVEEVAYSGVR